LRKYSTILFDLGRVLVNIDFDAFPRSLGIDPEHARLDKKTAVGRLAIRYETGRLTSDEFFETLGELFHGRYTREQLVAAWNAIIREENSAIVPIVDAVQARYSTAVLSNTSPTHFQKAYDTTTIIKKFSNRYLSFQIGAVKPDPEVYNYVLRDLSTEPSTIVLIDDVAENVEAAGRCGMVGILFEDVAKLEKDLRGRRILV
jgi:HAD superfamily hydrolase (TIGR01509 family)